MQDRFKFRCFSHKTKKMYEVDSLHLDNKEGEWVWVHYYNPIYDKDLKIQIVQPQAVIMQCTGLKDKNGKLIYDGDIVKFKTELFGKPKQIIWDECHYMLKNTFIILCNMEIKQFGLEVIGNIYQNPELLED